MLRFKVSFEVDADIDGWAKALDITAPEALSEVLRFLREQSDPTRGQAFLTLVDDRVEAYFELLAQPAPKGWDKV